MKRTLLILGPLVILGGLILFTRDPPSLPVAIGALHSLTGTMAASEKPLVDAMTLAVEEINTQGGVLGRPVRLEVADSRSDDETAAQEAERLIRQERVAALFGCWTSSCRKAVEPVVARHGQRLFYPLQYEGMETSPYVVYTGLVPNQQIIPAVLWAMSHLGKRFYLVGSDYLFPRTANHIITDLARAQGAQVVAERYLKLGTDAVKPVVEEMRALKPDVVFNTINGDTNLHFFRALHQAGVDAAAMPVLSFSLPETELSSAPEAMAGHYAAWSYFHGIGTPGNQVFIERFQARFGRERVVGDAMEAAYLGVRLWANGVREAGTLDSAPVDRMVMRQSLNAPQGIVSVDPATRHLWRTARIGQAGADGRFAVVWSSRQPLRPTPFPTWLSRGHDSQPLAMTR